MAKNMPKAHTVTQPIVVLGGFGFMGSCVVNTLKNHGYPVVAASRRNGVDITNLSSIKSLLTSTKPNIIINCAAHKGSVHYVTKFAADIVHDNLTIILTLYRAIQQHSPDTLIINPISNCSYPGDAKIQKETEWWDGPVHPSVLAYASTKRMWQVISECYAMEYHIRTKNFIVPNGYGPGDYIDPMKTHALNGMIIRMMEAKKNKTPVFEIWGSGKPQREWIYVQDFANLMLKVIKDPTPQIEPLNIAQNKAYSILEIAKKIKRCLHYDGKLLFNTEYQDGALIKKLDAHRFRSAYPTFMFTDLTVGIEKTVSYYNRMLS